MTFAMSVLVGYLVKIEGVIKLANEKTVPIDAYRFVDFYGDGFERLQNLINDLGYAVVADLYTYAIPLSLFPYANYGWCSLEGYTTEKTSWGGTIYTLPIPEPFYMIVEK